jgi:putative transposase
LVCGRSPAWTAGKNRFPLDYCDRKAISWVATTGGLDSGDMRDLMIDSVERRFWLAN